MSDLTLEMGLPKPSASPLDYIDYVYYDVDKNVIYATKDELSAEYDKPGKAYYYSVLVGAIGGQVLIACSTIRYGDPMLRRKLHNLFKSGYQRPCPPQ